MSSPTEPLGQIDEQTALACYLRVVVAVGNCMADVCPPVGAMYRDRLLKLPRRLGFEATPQALEQSREAVETDLLEYATTAAGWINAGVKQTSQLLDHMRANEETLTASADLQGAFLDDLAEHMEASAEVDDEAALRRSFQRYASGLRAYARRANKEKLAAVEEFRQRREELEGWLTEATVSDYNDPESGLLNRAAGERRLQTEIMKKRPFCVISVEWTPEEPFEEANGAAGRISKELADRLAATVRPYDVIFHWARRQLITVFEAPESDIAARAKQIAGWLGQASFTLDDAVVKTHVRVSVVESGEGETSVELIERLELVSARELVAK